MKYIIIICINILLLCFCSCNKNNNSRIENDSKIVNQKSKVYKQGKSAVQYNLLDSNNKKTGYWTEDGYIKHYQNGKLNGFTIEYDRSDNPKTIRSFGEFKDNNPVGNWHYFDENGLLCRSETIEGLNDNLYAVSYDGKKILPKYKSYVKDFYPNGFIEKEGYMVYEDIEIYAFRVGKWKFYDSTGVYIKTEIQDGKWHP